MVFGQLHSESIKSCHLVWDGVGYILRKEMHTGKLKNGKWTGTLDMQEIICMVKKKSFMIAQQVSNVLQDEGIHVLLSTIKRRLCNNLRKFTTRRKPLICLRNIKAIAVCNGTLAFIDNFTADRNKRTNAEVYRCILCAHFKSNISKLVSHHSAGCWTRIYSQCNQRAFQGEWNILKWQSQLSDLIPLVEDQTTGREIPQQARAEGGCREDQGRFKACADVHGSKTSDNHWPQWIFQKILNIMIFMCHFCLNP